MKYEISLPVLIILIVCFAAMYSVSYANDNNSSSCAITLSTKSGNNIASALKSVRTKACTIIVDAPQPLGVTIIPKNITLKFTKNGYFLIPKGNTVKVQGYLEAPLQQIFYGEGAVLVKNSSREVYPQWWGAKGDGVSDDTLAIQKSVDALSVVGGTVYFEPGKYPARDLALYSNIRLTGSKEGEAILSHISGKVPEKVESLIGIGKLYREAGDTTKKAHHIEISRITFVGRVLQQGFSEHHHLVYLHAASDVLIHDCKFVGFQGDGIYIGQRGKSEQHNERIKISNCVFDGINNDNRNGISVTDGTDIVVEGNSFVNCTRKNMPGNIDIEPNYTYDRIHNITIKGNKFEKYYGNKGAICIYFSRPLSSYLTQPSNFVIENNFIDKDYYNAGAGAQNAIIVYSYNQAVTSKSHNMDINITSNKIFNDIRILGAKGINFTGNTVSAFNRYCMFGDITNSNGLHNISDAIISNNIFDNTGNANGALSIGNAINVKAYGNTFSRIKSNGIVLAGYKAITSSDNIKIYSNKFIGPMAKHIIRQSTHNSKNIAIYDNYSEKHPASPHLNINGI